jgi:SAM-dependent methyltransferase
MEEQEQIRMREAEAWHWWYHSLHAFLRQRARLLPQQGRALDLGSGSGKWLSLLREEKFDAQGVELCAPAAEHAQKLGLKVAEGDMLEFLRGQPDRSFDLITSIDSLYFLENAEQSLLLREAHRCLRKNGRIFLHVPALKIFSREHDLTVGIRRRFRRSDLTQLLHSAGLAAQSRIRPRLCFLSLGILVRKTQQKLFPRASSRSDLFSLPRVLNQLLLTYQRWEDSLPVLPWGSSFFVEITAADNLSAHTLTER